MCVFVYCIHDLQNSIDFPLMHIRSAISFYEKNKIKNKNENKIKNDKIKNTNNKEKNNKVTKVNFKIVYYKNKKYKQKI